MFPSYGYMDSYPHTSPPHRDNIPYACHHYPVWEAVSPQARADQQRPPASFVPWPINGVIHPNPTDCNACGSHSYPPVYYDSRHPYVHMPPPPHVYYNGHPPNYYGSYPSFTIPPHYPTDHMYSYNGVKNHCCDCPNHSGSKGHNNSVKIQEHKSEDDQDQVNEASSLIRLPNYPYPVACIPPNNSMGKFPAIWNGWVPSDISSLKWDGNVKKDIQANERRNQFPWPIVWMPSDEKSEDATKDLKEVNEKHDEDGKKSLQTIEKTNPFAWPIIWMPSDQKSEDSVSDLKEVEPKRDDGRGRSLQTSERRNQFPWPIVWKPSDEKSEEPAKDVKEFSPNPKAEEKLPSRMKIIPLKLLEDESLGRQPKNVDDKHKTSAHPQTVVEDKRRIKTIPVKHVENNLKKLYTDEIRVVKEKDRSLSTAEKKMESGGNKAPDNKQVPQTKTSKLPPVCLRLDPLPKKKTTNGASRSPSPPNLEDRKEASKDKPEKEQTVLKVNMLPKKGIPTSDVNREVQDSTEKSKKLSQDMMSTENAAEIVGMQQSNEGEKKNYMKVNTTEPREDGNKIHEKDGKQLEDKGYISHDGKKGRKILSESDAATIIQSAYRGFAVRRWQPLEKLRKIGQIRQKAELLKKQIQEFDVSIDQNSKQKTVLSESIMNLLLQLDTIQGLNQSLRDMRKAVARELVSLQEKLDSVGAASIIDPEKLKFEQCASADSGSEANPAAVSSESASVGSQHETCQPIEVDRKEAFIEQQKDVEVAIAESLDSVTGLDDVKSAALEKPIPSDEHEIEHPREQLCPRSEVVESNAIGDELEVLLEEVKPLASASLEIFEAPAISEDSAIQFEKDKHHLERQETNAFVGQIGNERCVAQARSDAKDVVELAKSSMVTVEHEATEPMESSASDKVGAMSEELPGQSQSDDLDEKIVAGANAVHVENPCSDEATLGACDSADHVRSVESDNDGTYTSLPTATYASLAETNAMPVLDSDDITKVEDKSISYKADGAPPEEANASPLLSAPVDSSVPAVDNSHSLKEAPEPGQADVTDSNSPADAVDAMKDESIVADETFETTVNRHDGAPAEETSPPMNMAEPAVSTEKQHVALSGDNAELQGPSSGINLSKQEKKLVEENEKLREMLERLLDAGKAQMGVIADLSGRVKDLEKKLSQNKRCKVKSYKPRRMISHRVVS